MRGQARRADILVRSNARMPPRCEKGMTLARRTLLRTRMSARRVAYCAAFSSLRACCFVAALSDFSTTN
jgi:hypothetical protein